MLPSLSPLSDDPGVAGAVVKVPPPPRFRPLVGRPRNITLRPGLATGSVGRTAAQKAGLRYETKAQEYLSRVLGGRYNPSPYLHFQDDTGFRTAIPDGILHHTGSRDVDRYVVVVEIKSQHCPEAWWQLTKLYAPVLRTHLNLPVFCLEVCRSYDPAMPFPAKISLVDDLLEFSDYPTRDLGVFVWKP